LISTGASQSVTFKSAASSFGQGLVILAADGVTFEESVTTESSPTTIVAGGGAFTISDHKSVSTTNQLLIITADDIDLGTNVSLNSGDNFMRMAPFTDATDIGVGSPTAAFHLDDAELAAILSDGLTIGDSFSGSISAGDISNTSTADINLLTLKAMSSGQSVSFTAKAAVRGLAVHANENVLIDDLTTTQGAVINAGSGVITLSSGKQLSTSHSSLVLIADGIDIQGSSVDCGSSTMQLAPFTRNVSVALGDSSGQFALSATEISVLSAAGLTVGMSHSSGSIRISNISNTSSIGIAMLTLLATVDDSQIIFEPTASTFQSLAVQANNGIVISGDLTTISGGMVLNGDEENSSTSDDLNTVWLNDMSTISAKGTLTLVSTSTQAGTVTLNAGQGVVLQDSLTGLAQGTKLHSEWANEYKTGNHLLINADSDSSGDGALIVSSNAGVVNANSNIQIIAWDVDIAAGAFIDSGTGWVRINASTPMQTVGLGTAADMHLTDGELGMISAQGSLAVYRNGKNSDMVVHQISQLYKAEPERIVFNQDFWTNADMSTEEPYSSNSAWIGVVKKETQVHHLDNDFLPTVEYIPVMDVPEIVSLGMEIIIEWTADQLGSRLSNEYDWVGLFKKGECAQTQSMEIPDPEQLVNTQNYVNKCYLQAVSLGRGGFTSGTVRFQPEAYAFTAGQYEVRYFLGESRDSNGYVCTSMPGVLDYSANCLLHAQATSSPISVVKASSAESLDRNQLPGLEVYQDSDDGAMYTVGF